MLIQFWKRRKKQCVSIVCSISILFSCEATFLEEKKSSKEVENERFTSFTEKLFCKEVAASQISLHYTLKEPEAYGIDKADTAYGTIQTDSTQIKTAAENIQQALYTFSYEKLNVKNKIQSMEYRRRFQLYYLNISFMTGQMWKSIWMF